MPDLLRDTSVQADAIQLQSMRRMTPARRAMLATSLSRTVMAGSRQGIARRSPTFYLSETEMREALAQREGYPSFKLIHLAMGVKIDVFVQPATTYAATRMAQAVPAAFEEDPQARRLYIASAEDMILTKLAWYATGNRTSDRQWTDIMGMLQIQQDLLDLAYLQQWTPALGVADLLVEAIAAAGV
ncbi:MAG TPA: hypothetical protein VD886_18395 [Herpetosiphonaceae bacterium]|nr:hypothetical protein [Herpetosiphonaceae bacterium]